MPQKEGVSVDSDKTVYGWKKAGSVEAHDYQWPAIEKILVASQPGKPLSILDVGCGTGYIASRLAAKGHRVVGLDASVDGLLLAREAYPDVRFEVASVYDDLSAFAKGVDLVTSVDVIEHLYRPGLLLQRAFEVLRPCGTLVLTTPYHGYLKNLMLSLANKWDYHLTADWEGGHIKFFSEKVLGRMLRKTGFVNLTFHNAGRIPFLWKSLVCRAEKPASG